MTGSQIHSKEAHAKIVNNVKYLLKRLDNEPIPSDKEEIRLFAVARNEELRLLYFLQYYFKNGVDRVFIIDNCSTDSTVEIALSVENVHVFQVQQDYKGNYGYWMEYFLETYGTNYWCIVVDIDELFLYPFIENIFQL